MKDTTFGELREATGITITDYQYTGQRNETATGLYNYVARWYDPVIGHFISADTILPGVFNPKTYDRYAYVVNNPLKFIDPSGHFSRDAINNYLTEQWGRKAVNFYIEWQDDKEWWSMITNAKAGDILFGGVKKDPTQYNVNPPSNNGSPVMLTFEGSGNTVLNGVYVSDLDGDSLFSSPSWTSAGLRSASLEDIQGGILPNSSFLGAPPTSGNIVWDGAIHIKDGVMNISPRSSREVSIRHHSSFSGITEGIASGQVISWGMDMLFGDTRNPNRMVINFAINTTIRDAFDFQKDDLSIYVGESYFNFNYASGGFVLEHFYYGFLED